MWLREFRRVRLAVAPHEELDVLGADVDTEVVEALSDLLALDVGLEGVELLAVEERDGEVPLARDVDARLFEFEFDEHQLLVDVEEQLELLEVLLLLLVEVLDLAQLPGEDVVVLLEVVQVTAEDVLLEVVEVDVRAVAVREAHLVFRVVEAALRVEVLEGLVHGVRIERVRAVVLLEVVRVLLQADAGEQVNAVDIGALLLVVPEQPALEVLVRLVRERAFQRAVELPRRAVVQRADVIVLAERSPLIQRALVQRRDELRARLEVRLRLQLHRLRLVGDVLLRAVRGLRVRGVVVHLRSGAFS